RSLDPATIFSTQYLTFPGVHAPGRFSSSPRSTRCSRISKVRPAPGRRSWNHLPGVTWSDRGRVAKDIPKARIAEAARTGDLLDDGFVPSSPSRSLASL